MGVALIWVEGLAVALFTLALAIAWAARGTVFRWLWAAVVYLVFFGASGFLSYATFNGYSNHGPLLRSTWVTYTTAWLTTFAFLGGFIMWTGFRRQGAGLGRPASTWPRRGLWLGFAGSVLAFGFTVWNIDLSARAD